MKEERLVKFNKYFVDVFYSRLKILFAGSIAVASAVIVICLIIKIKNGSLNDIAIAAEYMIKRTNKGIKYISGVWFPFISKHISKVSLKNLSACFSAVKEKSEISFAGFSTVLSDLSIHVKKQPVRNFDRCVKLLNSGVTENISALWDRIVYMWEKVRYTIEGIPI